MPLSAVFGEAGPVVYRKAPRTRTDSHVKPLSIVGQVCECGELYLQRMTLVPILLRGSASKYSVPSLDDYPYKANHEPHSSRRLSRIKRKLTVDMIEERGGRGLRGSSKEIMTQRKLG